MNYKEALKHRIFKIISQSAKELNVDSYVIGGFVRDFLLNRGDAKDIDIVAIGVVFNLQNKLPKTYQKNPKYRYLKPMVPPCFTSKILK